MKSCHRCGNELPAKERVGTRDVCLSCGACLHCCLNCRLYSASSAEGCLSRTTEFVSDKQKSNYCDEFNFKETEARNSVINIKDGRKSKEAWDKLFKK